MISQSCMGLPLRTTAGPLVSTGLAGSHEQDRAWRAAQHLSRYTAEDRPLQPAPAMGRHDDEVHTALPGVLQDDLSRGAFWALMFGGESRAAQAIAEPREVDTSVEALLLRPCRIADRDGFAGHHAGAEHLG